MPRRMNNERLAFLIDHGFGDGSETRAVAMGIALDLRDERARSERMRAALVRVRDGVGDSQAVAWDALERDDATTASVTASATQGSGGGAGASLLPDG